MTAAASRPKVAGAQGHFAHRCTLDSRGDRVIAEGRRAHDDLVLPGTAERAHQQVDRLVAAAAGEDPACWHPVEAGQPLEQRAGLRLRIAIESGVTVVARRAPRHLVGVQALERRVPGRMLVRLQLEDVRPREAENVAHDAALASSADSRTLTARACASSPSIRASVIATGPSTRKALGCGFLHGDALDEVGHAQTAERARMAAGRQHVVGAAAVVAQRLRRPRAEEYRAGVAHDAASHARGAAMLQDQVLRRVLVADFERRFEIGYDGSARGRRGDRLGDVATGQVGELVPDRLDALQR